jgi:hypothetical protein
MRPIRLALTLMCLACAQCGGGSGGGHPDLVPAAGDLARSEDMRAASDLATGDSAPPVDQMSVADLARPPDLAAGSDLAVVPDMTGKTADLSLDLCPLYPCQNVADCVVHGCVQCVQNGCSR